MKYDKKERVQSEIAGKWAQSTRGTFRRSLMSVAALVQPDLWPS